MGDKTSKRPVLILVVFEKPYAQMSFLNQQPLKVSITMLWGEGITFFILLRDAHIWKYWEPFLCWCNSLFMKHTSCFIFTPSTTPSFYLACFPSYHDLAESDFSFKVQFDWNFVSEAFSSPWSQKCSSVPIYYVTSHTTIVWVSYLSNWTESSLTKKMSCSFLKSCK